MPGWLAPLALWMSSMSLQLTRGDLASLDSTLVIDDSQFMDWDPSFHDIELGESQTSTTVFADLMLIPKAVSSGDSVFFKASTGNMLSVEGAAIAARGKLHTVRQSFVLEKNGGGGISSGDTVHIKSELNGKYVSFADSSVQALSPTKEQAQAFKIEKHDPSGLSANSPLMSNDIVAIMVTRTNKFLKVDGFRTQAADTLNATAPTLLTMQKEGVQQAYCCDKDRQVQFIDLNGDGQNGLNGTKDECEQKCKSLASCKFFQLDTTASQSRCVGFSACAHLCDADVGMPQTIYKLNTNGRQNVAQGKPTTQSSTGASASADRAVDGNTTQDFNQNSCSQTEVQWQPWWRLNLTQPMAIDDVTVWNRADCCGGRLAGFEVRVGNDLSWDNNPTCDMKNVSTKQGHSTRVHCGRTGKYVYVDIKGRRDSLALCEVEVFAAAVDVQAQVEDAIFRNMTYKLEEQIAVLANMTLVPFWMEDTETAGFSEGVKVAVAMSTGRPMHSMRVDVLEVIPVTNFSKGSINFAKNDSASNSSDTLEPPPTVQVNLKVQPVVAGGEVLEIAKRLQEKADSGYLAKKLQDRLAVSGIFVEPYTPALIDKLTMTNFTVATTSLSNCTTDKRCFHMANVTSADSAQDPWAAIEAADKEKKDTGVTLQDRDFELMDSDATAEIQIIE